MIEYIFCFHWFAPPVARHLSSAEDGGIPSAVDYTSIWSGGFPVGCRLN